MLQESERVCSSFKWEDIRYGTSPFLLAAKGFLVTTGQICFCLSRHSLAEGQDTNVPAVIQRKLSLDIFRSVQGYRSKRLLSYSIMIIIM